MNRSPAKLISAFFKTTLFAAAMLHMLHNQDQAQSSLSAVVNNPYAPSPVPTARTAVRPTPSPTSPDHRITIGTNTVAATNFQASGNVQAYSERTAAKTVSLDPTSLYRIGINDVLSVEIQDVGGPPKTVTVLRDGTIDFPLAGDDVVVAGKTPAEAEAMLVRGIKLYRNAHVTLHVKEHISHIINVWGLVEQPGEKQIPRDAVPFFVVRANTGIDPRAKFVRIVRRASPVSEEYPLQDPALNAILIFPGDSIEFGSCRLNLND
jgi:protein involved in polysaccharide export with SLBB domain